MARRNKKVVDYSQFGDADDDDDEDFASIAAPSNKKSKRVRSEKKKEKKEPQTKLLRGEVELQKRAANKRVALDHKLYQRDLEVALELSVSEPTLGNCKVKESQEQVQHESANECNQTITDFGQRTAASQQKVLTESQGSASSAHSYEPETASIQAKPEPALKRAPSSSESVGKPLKTSGSTALKRPSWTPPALSGSSNSPPGGVLVKSPTQSLRLGLSRLARVKPLHPSAASV